MVGEPPAHKLKASLHIIPHVSQHLDSIELHRYHIIEVGGSERQLYHYCRHLSAVASSKPYEYDARQTKKPACRSHTSQDDSAV